jgi:hypothetical protein
MQKLKAENISFSALILIRRPNIISLFLPDVRF